MKSQNFQPDQDNAIAIIGMSGRFPGAPDVDEFWELLRQGREGVADAPADRSWMYELHGEPRTPGKVPTTRGGFLPGVGDFDAGFFGMSRREAIRADPQLRLLLEVAHETAEDAGATRRQLTSATTGVYIGNTYGDYWLRQIGDPEGLDHHAEFGVARSSLSGHVAYGLDLHGPTMTVDAACSSSLVAVHLACQALRAGECEQAFAGGTNIILAPSNYLTFNSAGALSPDGRCKFGDASANGYVRAEAVGAVLLKPLRRALADGDRIRAVILGSAVNSVGFTGRGIAAPTVEGQAEVLRAAYAQAGVDPREVSYVEAHGSGTPVGDPIELTALSQVLGPRGPGEPDCLVGSAKVNVGHTEGAAGIVGLIKTVLTLENGVVPGNPHLRELTHAVDWDAMPVQISARNAPLNSTGGRSIAGVNGLGASGTNAHVVLASAPAENTRRSRRSAAGTPVLPLSARSEDALRELSSSYQDLLSRPDAPPLEDLCAAAGQHRHHWEHRLAITAADLPGMRAGLAGFLAGQPEPGTATGSGGEPPRVVFVFPGQGSQWPGMGRRLLEQSEAFRTTLEACDAVIREHVSGWSLIEALRLEDTAFLQETAKVQPALWAMGVALAEHWRSWGVTPDAVIGQSQGEIAAAQAAGVLSLEQAGHLSCLRARLIQDLAPPGSMAWVEISPEELPDLLATIGAEASIAVSETRGSVVLAGHGEEIARIVRGCEKLGVDCQEVKVSYAAHSPQIDAVREPLLEGLTGLVPSAGDVPVISTVTTGELPGHAFDADYWWRNLRETVRLEETVRSQLGHGPVVFLQMSPHPVLTAPISSIADGAEATVLGSLRRNRDELDSLRESLAELYVAGVDVDWERVHGFRAEHVELPRYPWQRDHYWYQSADYPWPEIAPAADAAELPAAAPPSAAPPAAAGHDLLGAATRNGPDGCEWIGQLDLERNRFLTDHRVSGTSVMPGAAFMELALAAAAQLPAAGAEPTVRELVLRQLLLLDDDTRIRVRIEEEDGTRRVVVASCAGSGDTWTDHAEATVGESIGAVPLEPLDAVRARCTALQSGERFYAEHAGRGNTWDGAFAGIAELELGTGELLAHIAAPMRGNFLLHPAALDACIQPVAALLPDGWAADGRGFVLEGVDRITVHRAGPDVPLCSHVRMTHVGETTLRADITVYGERDEVVATLRGVRGRALVTKSEGTPEQAPARTASAATATNGNAGSDYDDWFHGIRWDPIAAEDAERATGRWLVLHSGTDLDSALREQLEMGGNTVVTVRPGRGFAVEGADRYRIALGSDEDLELAIKDASRRGALCGVIDLTPLDVQIDPDAASEVVQRAAEDLCSGATALARVLGTFGQGQAPRLFLVTRGAQRTSPEDPSTAPWQAALWGFGKVLGVEHPELDPVLIDLPAAAQPGEAAALSSALLGAGTENQLALRGDRVLVARLVLAPPVRGGNRTQRPADGVEVRAESLALEPFRRVAPGPGQVEIEVSHSGLNFKDVLIATGTISLPNGKAPVLGAECAGTVARVGPGVTEFAVGEPVMAIAHPGMRSHVVTDARLVARRPAPLTAAEAAVIPAAHVTAYLALIEIGRLQPGETVLVHSGTGGVGQAALDIARWRGATVYATAGTPAKRDLLLKLGAAKTADSRSLAYEDEFADGVDIVLGTNVDEHVEAGFRLLKPLGRYVDLVGKGAGSGQALPMSLFTQNRSYSTVDLADLHVHSAQVLGDALREVGRLLETGELAPPTHRVFPAERAADAFGVMSGGRHIGKLALSFPRAERSAPSAAPSEPAVRADGTYLITGGMSGIGALFARWLHERGARHLLITGRSTNPADRGLLELPGVRYAAVDVSDEDAMAALLRDGERAGHPPVVGVVHAAGVLEPGPLADQSESERSATLRPKVAGAWSLHKLFADRPLDFFVLFSSGVSPFSSLTAGYHLSAYAAGNTFLDSLASYRNARGLPATVVDWGYWSETGLAARLSARGGHDVRPTGMGAIRPADAAALFGLLLAHDQGQVICTPADWEAYAAAYPADASRPLLRALLNGTRQPVQPPRPPAAPTLNGSSSSKVAGRGDASLNGRSSARPVEVVAPVAPVERAVVPERVVAEEVASSNGKSSGGGDLAEYVVGQLARILGVGVDRVDQGRRMNQLGMDSLMLADLRTRLRRDRGIDVTVARLLEAGSVRSLIAELTKAGESTS
ncbi:myxalamid-type polyketide synthase MxaB [Saccharopolyspora kobensis]|uniref:Myxalamid-type polyketide synthase MxaB n=3 Tax=Saccharopolyspora kobensis TaxID=146035 RepID=A0A1H6A5J2_9PSEU|nr:type I polyketide synthase [Saccharopolyspora kobensis]SEG44008.1 myxalamid-type polyketide synthase MxaB [Saccharopolyspora kobensis]